MTKNELVTYLENRLSVLNKAERDDIINEYLQHIDNKLSEGLTESEAIKTLGNIEDMVRETLSAYNVDPDYDSNTSQPFDRTKENIKSIISSGIVRIKAAVKTFGDYILGQKASELLMFVFKLIILFFVLCALFMLGFWLVEILINIMGGIMGFYDFFEGILYFLYLVIAVPTFIYIFIRFIAMHTGKSRSSSEKAGSLSAIKTAVNEKAKEYRLNTEERRAQRAQSNRSFFKDIFAFVKKLVLLLIKAAIFCAKIFMIVFCFIPALFMLMGSIVLFAFLLVFAIMGYPCIGFSIAVLGFDMSAVSIFIILIKLLFFRKKEVVSNE